MPGVYINVKKKSVFCYYSSMWEIGGKVKENVLTVIFDKNKFDIQSSKSSGRWIKFMFSFAKYQMIFKNQD